MNADSHCQLCGQKLQIQLLDRNNVAKCNWCGGEHVVIGGYDLGWMYLGEKDDLDKIPFSNSRGLLWLLDLLLSSQQKAQENQGDEKHLSRKFEEQTVALWGATHAGKSWMFDAFIQRMLKYNSVKLKQKGSKFSFFSIDPNNVEREIGLGDVQLSMSTSDSIEKIFVFRREDTNKADRRAVNSHCHTIRLIDDTGKKFVGKSANIKDAAQKAVANSKFIMIALNISSDTIEDLVNGLATLKDGISTKGKKHIAVCFTKADLFPEFFNNENHPSNENLAKKLIEKHFGQDHQIVLDTLDALETDGHCLEYFVVSSCGFLQNGRPNFDLSTGHLINKNFTPVNVELPFLWLFQMIEQARCEPDLSTLYPFLFSGSKKGTKNGMVVKKQRIKRYKTYKALLDVCLPKSRKTEDLP